MATPRKNYREVRISRIRRNKSKFTKPKPSGGGVCGVMNGSVLSINVNKRSINNRISGTDGTGPRDRR